MEIASCVSEIGGGYHAQGFIDGKQVYSSKKLRGTAKTALGQTGIIQAGKLAARWERRMEKRMK